MVFSLYVVNLISKKPSGEGLSTKVTLGNYGLRQTQLIGDYEIADDTSIVIEDGATMIVSGSMNSSQPPQLDLAATSSVIVPVNNIAASGTMRIHFAGTVVYGIDIEINTRPEN